MVRAAVTVDAPRRPIFVQSHRHAAEAGARPPYTHVAGLLDDRDLEVDLARDARQPRQPRRDLAPAARRAAAGKSRAVPPLVGVMRGASGQGPAPVELDGPVVAHRHLPAPRPPQPVAAPALIPARNIALTAYPPEAPRASPPRGRDDLKRGCHKGTWAASPRRTSGRPRRSTQACAAGRVRRRKQGM